ncbi:carbohydrate-binding domain-containing protein [Candidatus Saccharibacteria bacterium]|nr:carbohydrate-binding domain-containing protein [Candidatus Saccharibacteria bacterium]
MRKRNLLPTILIITIPLVIIALVVILFGVKSSDSELGDNITSNQMAVNSANSKTLTLTKTTKISEPGVYTLVGEIADGMLSINTVGVVQLILNNVTITNSNGPAIYVENASTVIIETADGSTNTLTDSSIYEGWDEDVCGALFSHDDLVLQGAGTLIVNGNFEDGIVGKDDLKIISGQYVVSARDEGIRGRDSIYIVDGKFDITAGGDALKANNSEEVAKGWVKIDGGVILASAGDDGIHAESSVEINGGTIEISQSYEGIEGAKITINGGAINVTASDDGINAAGGNDGSSPNMARFKESSGDYAIAINGGTIHIASNGDGIDSNGTVSVNGGEVIVDGPVNAGNGALDAETGIIYNGGSIIAVGSSGMAVAPATSSEKYSISVFFDEAYRAGTELTLKDEDGNVLLSHTSLKTFQHAVLSHDSLAEGKTYYIYVDGDRYTSVTLSGKTTQVGQGGGMMPGDGMNAPGNNGGRQPGSRW